MSEELELVTDFASLRAGDLTVVKNCTQCGAKRCRAMLTVMNECSECGMPAWLSLPECTPAGPCICRQDVKDRIVYRVVIPPAAETRETARPKKLERA